MDAGGCPGRERADHGDLVGGRFHDLLPRLLGGDQRAANRRHGRQVRELAQDVVEGVQTVADGHRQQVGPVVGVQHVDVGLDHDVARDRHPDQRR